MIPPGFLSATRDRRLSATDLAVLADLWESRAGTDVWLPVHARQVARRLTRGEGVGGATVPRAVTEREVCRALRRLVAAGYLERHAAPPPPRRHLRTYRLTGVGPRGAAPDALRSLTA